MTNKELITIIVIAFMIGLLWYSVLPAFSQSYTVYPWDLRSVSTYDSAGNIYLTNEDLAYHIWDNPDTLDITYHVNLNEFGCVNDIDIVTQTAAHERQEEERLLMTYTDLKGNTMKIYCQYNEWLGEDKRLRQYTAFYNDKVLVGLCPYDSAVNRHEIYTNDEGEIERIYWLSIRTNGSDYTIYNNYFG